MIKRFLSILTVIILVAASALPAFALGPTAQVNNDYIIEEQSYIGWDGCAVTVRSDGSFEYAQDGAAVYVSFGVRVPEATVTKSKLPYPVTTHKYTIDGVSYTVEQFALGDEGGAVCVYSRFTVKNETESAVSFPTVTGTVPIGTPPSAVDAKETASCDYIVSLKASTVESSLKAETFDSAKEKMKDHWDSYLSSLLTVSSLAKNHKSAVTAYRAALIDYTVAGTVSPAVALASADLARDVISRSNDAYTCALAAIKLSDVSLLTSADSIRNVVCAIIDTEKELPCPSLEENLDALLTVQSYAYLLKKLSETDPARAAEADEAKVYAEKLAKSIASAIKDIEKDIPFDWEVATTDSSAPITLSGADRASVKALCSWYIKSSVFTDVPSKDLVALAKDANPYYSSANDPCAAILSLFCEREDKTVLIGRGAPTSLLATNESITVSNIALSAGNTVSLNVTAKKNTVGLSLSGASSTPYQIEFPLLCDNTEYASVGFDCDCGVVSAPEGTGSVSVRLFESIFATEANRKAAVKLEIAICEAYEKQVESPTTISKEEFDAALKKAEKSRTATADEKRSCAEKLQAATEALSPMIAGYVYSSPTEDIPVGTVTNTEVYQKFSLPSDGTVTSLFVKGEFSEGISAAIYTLRGDNYTTDELRAESYGTEAEGGITFDVEFEAVAETVYVLCIFSEDSAVSLTLEKSAEATAHTVNAGEVVVYTAASLAFDLTVEQANRRDLDTFYSACLEANVSEYTKESQKTLKNKMKAAKAILCTASVTEDECEKTYDDLKKAFDGLDTYASEDRIEETPTVGLILIGIVIILLAGTFITALAARKKMNSDS